MFQVTVQGWFSAAHQLRLPDGSYEALHGHDWQVRVTYAGEALDEVGLLADFGPIRTRLNDVLATLHHQNLNQLPAFTQRNPSAENVALHLAERLASHSPPAPRLHCVEVEEEPGCSARYFPK